jgi:hypothetical protein
MSLSKRHSDAVNERLLVRRQKLWLAIAALLSHGLGPVPGRASRTGRTGVHRQIADPLLPAAKGCFAVSHQRPLQTIVKRPPAHFAVLRMT